jgi:hypothetical protein
MIKKGAIWATRLSAYVLNSTPIRHSPSVCPREALSGVKPDLKVVLLVGLADISQVHQKHSTNSVTEFRAISALSLTPTGTGSVLFASLTTGRVISRDQFKIVQDIPNEYLLIVKALQERRVFAIEGRADYVALEVIDKSPEPASNPIALPETVNQNARENSTAEQLVVLSKVVDLLIETIDPNPNLIEFNIKKAYEL